MPNYLGGAEWERHSMYVVYTCKSHQKEYGHKNPSQRGHTSRKSPLMITPDRRILR